MILLNERFYWTNDFTEQNILLNKWFHWTKYFTEQMILLNDLSVGKETKLVENKDNSKKPTNSNIKLKKMSR